MGIPTQVCLVPTHTGPGISGSSDNTPHLGHFLGKQSQQSHRDSFPQAPQERGVKEEGGVQTGGPATHGRRHWQEDRGCLRAQGLVGSGSPVMPHRGSARPGQLLAMAVFISRAGPGVVSRWGSSERTCSHTLSLRLPLTAAREQSPIQPVQGACWHGGQPVFPGGRKSQLRDGHPVGAGPAPPSPHPSAPLPGGQSSHRARERGLPGGVTDPRHTASPQHPASREPSGRWAGRTKRLLWDSHGHLSSYPTETQG